MQERLVKAREFRGLVERNYRLLIFTKSRMATKRSGQMEGDKFLERTRAVEPGCLQEAKKYIDH